MLSGYLLQLFHIFFDRKLVELTGIDNFFGYAVAHQQQIATVLTVYVLPTQADIKATHP